MKGSLRSRERFASAHAKGSLALTSVCGGRGPDAAIRQGVLKGAVDTLRGEAGGAEGGEGAGAVSLGEALAGGIFQ